MTRHDAGHFPPYRLFLAAVVLVAACAGPATPAPRQDVVFTGSTIERTATFTVQPGYYIITRDVMSRASDTCYFFSRLVTADGGPVEAIEGPLVEPGASVSWITQKHPLTDQPYALDVQSACGVWKVTISRQRQFDFDDCDQIARAQLPAEYAIFCQQVHEVERVEGVVRRP